MAMASKPKFLVMITARAIINEPDMTPILVGNLNSLWLANVMATVNVKNNDMRVYMSVFILRL